MTNPKKTTTRKGGRPAKYPASILVDMTHEMRSGLQRRAKALDIPTNAYIRMLLNRALAPAKKTE